MPYKILEHTADVRLAVEAESLEQLFADALDGTMKILQGQVKEPRQEVKRKVSVQSGDRTALLVDFLNEVLLQTQTQREIYINIIFKQLTERILEAELNGVSVDGFGEDIKAVTYHEADVKQGKDGRWETVLVFDI